MPNNKRHTTSRQSHKSDTKPDRSVWTSIRSNVRQITFSILKAYFLISLTLFALEVLRSTLDPVYGSIPASRYQDSVTLAALLVSCSTYAFWRGSDQVWAKYLAVVALSAPTVQIYLFRYSEQLGPSAGPLLASLATSFPLTLVSGVTAGKRLVTKIEKMLPKDSYQKKRLSGGMLAHILNAAVCLIAYFEPKVGSRILGDWLRTQVVYSRSGVYYLLTLFYALLFPSGYLLFIVIPLLQSMLFGSYFPFPYANNQLNTTLHKHGYSLVARQESKTGYISVLDNINDGFRVMRCDHSLLGGEWIPPHGHAVKLREPIYAVFVMLEAVRLVVPETENHQRQGNNRQENALVIGLGIGTTPSALIAHGINTTIVEIDPVVHAFATRYFNLPSNHTPIIQDAVAFLDHNQHQNDEKYDYIIHDVFTGGAEPLHLFTAKFLQGLREMLKPDGVIAINYAGNLNLPLTTAIIRTTLSVFPPSSCRFFREEPPKDKAADFTNLVLFCRKGEKNPGRFHFRPPTSEDFLGSQAREVHLLPRHEVDAHLSFPRERDDKTEEMIITNSNVHVFATTQMQSAVGHWGVMRQVMPGRVWENW
ncbi:MAG: hypothetical protein LQ338_002494 [Usnochroma carphineum]|nr:MAG: hypothetical protein LQ338_002494 [Usnochroma carphineum]